ncbi:MAG TPA: cache domain-containing protein, partial [Anaerolineales bacterium]|nr:cache domain-containing protein [Anaerolineales bacterium]
MIVAILLAGLATWLVSQSFARALQERFRGQLVDSSVAASDALFKIELDQLTGVRAIARTSGVTEALTAHSWDGLDRIVRPLVVNSRLSLVHVLDSAGRPVYGIRATPEGFAENENADFASWAPVRHVLAGERDDLGDKYVGLVDAPWGLTLYTVGPVKDGNKLVGAVMVGTPLTDIADAMSSASTANITIFRPN